MVIFVQPINEIPIVLKTENLKTSDLKKSAAAVKKNKNKKTLHASSVSIKELGQEGDKNWGQFLHAQSILSLGQRVHNTLSD